MPFARTWIAWLCRLALASALQLGTAAAQEEKTFRQEDLDRLLAPVALYPDPLLAQVLMASTYPADVAEAAAWSKQNAGTNGDDAVKAVADKPWDPSVQSLMAFPQALAMMGDKPDWVQELGDAFLAQPDEVMNAVQGLRRRAKDAGNLQSNEQQEVIVEPSPTQAQTTIVRIEPANPQVVYVPAYDPAVAYGPWWYPSYPPPFYWPPPPMYGFASGIAAGIGFGVGIAITDSLWGDCDWGGNDVDINVERYNNINVNKRIDARQGSANWRHDPGQRRGVPYRDAATRANFDRGIGGADQRREHRGKVDTRGASRERAQTTLQQRGVDPGRSREMLRDDPQTRQRAQQAVREPTRAGRTPTAPTAERARTASPAMTDRSSQRAAAQNLERSNARAATASRSGGDAFRGAGNAGRSQQEISRGRASRSAAAGGGGGRGGGGGGGGGGRGGGGGGGRR
jgi:hypothetical protein